MEHLATWTQDAHNLATTAALRLHGLASFFVLDVAETASGEWIVVEVNDAQMSGLSGVDPAKLYANMANVLRQNP